MKTFDWRLAPRFDQWLSARERELCALLGARDAMLARPADVPDVRDFKDVAAVDSLAAVDAAQVERAALELEQVLAARGRLHDHSFGTCLDCGDPIPLERLSAIPHTAYCTRCQALHEQADGAGAGTYRLH